MPRWNTTETHTCTAIVTLPYYHTRWSNPADHNRWITASLNTLATVSTTHAHMGHVPDPTCILVYPTTRLLQVLRIRICPQVMSHASRKTRSELTPKMYVSVMCPVPTGEFVTCLIPLCSNCQSTGSSHTPLNLSIAGSESRDTHVAVAKSSYI
jgi:hypothetical protein